MAKEGFGSARTAAELAEAKRHSNPAGERTEGRVVYHVNLLTGSRHGAHYTEDFKCSVCGEQL